MTNTTMTNTTAATQATQATPILRTSVQRQVAAEQPCVLAWSTSKDMLDTIKYRCIEYADSVLDRYATDRLRNIVAWLKTIKTWDRVNEMTQHYIKCYVPGSAIEESDLDSPGCEQVFTSEADAFEAEVVAYGLTIDSLTQHFMIAGVKQEVRSHSSRTEEEFERDISNIFKWDGYLVPFICECLSPERLDS